MESNKALLVINNFYSLLMEMNYYKEPEDFIEELQNEDKFISEHLKKVKLHRTKAKAILKKMQIEEFKEKFIALKNAGVEKIQGLFTPEEKCEIVRLFSRFEELTEKDIETINEDQEFLTFMSYIKDKLEDKDGIK